MEQAHRKKGEAAKSQSSMLESCVIACYRCVHVFMVDSSLIQELPRSSRSINLNPRS